MSSEGDKVGIALAKMRRFILETQQNGDLSLIDELVHPEYVEHTPAPGLSPYFDGVRPIMEHLHQTIRNVDIEILSMVSDGETVATHKVLRGVQVGDLPGKAATNAPIEIVIMDFLKLKDGKFVDRWGSRGPVVDVDA